MSEAFPVGPVILGYLEVLGPTHGYELLSRLHADLGRVWRVAPSQLYSTLTRLEKHGLITGEREEQENRPPRIRYALTQKGREFFWSWVTSPVPRVRLLRAELLPKLFFLLQLAPNRLPALLSAQREILISLRAKVEAECPADRFQQILQHFRLAQLAAGLTWINALLEKEVR
ncbi:MAG: PadR family transcriptional regulator [Candidatus Bipolaricaulota bacterium]|nr:PadR family transcriptional regulator [Candidatus Bipolaricaulota bacterium]MDW8126508.1 PadR family transcriptional regulator [Candidatus Bipolaricaulota bacterium]